MKTPADFMTFRGISHNLVNSTHGRDSIRLRRKLAAVVTHRFASPIRVVPPVEAQGKWLERSRRLVGWGRRDSRPEAAGSGAQSDARNARSAGAVR